MTPPEGPILETDAPPTYARTPRALLRDPRVSMQAKALWTILEDFASPERPEPFPGQVLLGEITGSSVATIRRWLTELEDAGWITVRREATQKGKRNHYRLLWRPCPQRSSTSGPQRSPVSGGQKSSVSGADRSPVSAEGEPGEEEPVEEENPFSASADAEAGTLPGIEAPKVADLGAHRERAVLAAFDEFWSVYKRVRSNDRLDALAAWKKALKKGVDPGVIIEGARVYLADCEANQTEQKLRKHGATFINKGSYENERTLTTRERAAQLAAEVAAEMKGS